MKIQTLFVNKVNLHKKQSENTTIPVKSEQTTDFRKSVVYRDYNISFGDRLNRTPENFYAQPFNRENMPATVKKYLFENYSERHHMPPAQLQREAYQYLTLADSVQDVKDIYPEEPLFETLRTLDDTKPSVGTLLMLKWDKQISNTPVFKNPENKDLTVYLLKKVYLEGKTVDEINKDFDKDATDAIKKELGISDKKYFSSTNFRTLGIKYPNLSYYNSFLATRNDKEYIPPVRTSSTHTVSSETRQKLSDSAKTWWAGLNELERMEQIQKMMNGKEFADSIFEKFKGPIMTLAAGKMNFSEKLSSVFAEKLSDEKFQEEFPTFEEQQREIMLEFWNKDPEFRKNYSIVLKSIIADFDFAYHEKEYPEYLEDLLNQALEQKIKILAGAKARIRGNKVNLPKEVEPPQNIQTPSKKLQVEPKKERLDESFVIGDEKIPFEPKPTLTSREIFRDFPIFLKKHLENHSKQYQDAMFDYLNKNASRDLKAKFVASLRPNAPDLLGVQNQEEVEDVIMQAGLGLNDLYVKYEKERPLLSRANNNAVAAKIYEITGDANVFALSNYELSIYPYLSEDQSKELKQSRKAIDMNVKLLSNKFPEKLARDFFIGTFYPQMIDRLKNGFVSVDYGQNDKQARAAMLELLSDKAAPGLDIAVVELQKHNAVIRAIKSDVNDEYVKDVLMDKLVRDYLYWVTQYIRENSTNVSTRNDNRIETFGYSEYANPKILREIKNAINSKGNIDVNPASTTSMKVALGCVLHNKYLKYFDDGYKMRFLDFAMSHSLAKKEIINELLHSTSFVSNSYINGVSVENQHIKEKNAQFMLKTLFEDFKNTYPTLANSYEFALKEAFANVSNKERSDIWLNDILYTLDHINIGEYSDKMKKQSSFITEKADRYKQELNTQEITEFYDKYVYDMFTKMVKTSYSKNVADRTEFDETILFINKNLIMSSDLEYLALLNHLKINSGVYAYVKNELNPLKVRIVVLQQLITDYVKSRMNKV